VAQQGDKMKLLVLLLFCTLALAQSNPPPDPYDEGTWIWQARVSEVTTLARETIEKFDPIFRQSSTTFLGSGTVISSEILSTPKAFTDTDGKSRQLAFLFAAQDNNQVVLVVLDYENNSSELSAKTLAFQLKKTVIDALDKTFKRVVPE
jgi:hypothetical protein